MCSFNKIKTTYSAGGVVLNKKKEVLIVNQHGTTWSLPKGHLEKNENKLDAAKREIYEESGIKNLELIKDLGEYQRFRIDKEGKEVQDELKNIFIFLFETNDTELKPIDPENPEAKWVKIDDVSIFLSHPKDKEFFELIKPNILR
ncbi:MAG: NUDIX domain-containing protein [Candidatus Sericytochromatia bacterium]